MPDASGRQDNGGTFPTSGFPGGYAPSFTNITPEAIRGDATNPLAGFDTVVLNGINHIDTFLANAQCKSRIEAFVTAGGKLVI